MFPCSYQGGLGSSWLCQLFMMDTPWVPLGGNQHGSLRKWTGEVGPGAGCTWKYNYREEEGKNEPQQDSHTQTHVHTSKSCRYICVVYVYFQPNASQGLRASHSPWHTARSASVFCLMPVMSTEPHTTGERCMYSSNTKPSDDSSKSQKKKYRIGALQTLKRVHGWRHTLSNTLPREGLQVSEQGQIQVALGWILLHR